MANIPFPRGVRDLMPNEALFRNGAIAKMESVLRVMGFLTIDTPTFESMAVLNAKNAIGEDSKLIYTLDDKDLGLRYDNTISLARYMAMHQELPLPFKRYYTGKVWRRDEPQKLRYREFTQVDADIIGGEKTRADAEVIAAAGLVLEAVGIDDYTVDVNDRSVADMVFEKFGVPKEKIIEVFRAIDKMEKLGEGKVSDIVKGLGLANEVVDQVMGFASRGGTNEQKLDYIKGILGESKESGDLKAVMELLKAYGLKGKINLNFSVMRGIDYYTGIIFECKIAGEDSSVSFGSGGRYDNLIGVYNNGKSIPAVGVAMGVDRILDHMGFSSSPQYTYAKAFVMHVKDVNYAYALQVANKLRASGIPTDINLASRNLANQMAYASSIKVKYALILGDVEQSSQKVKLRNMINGEELTLNIDEAVQIIEKG
ncbi:MAG TPA: histidine--tRNA ligase [Candidatus Acidoferrales bacterium]|nr:histidine--tRNA ligase [Candidatus Acidoferrales bacterium]